MQTEWKTRKNMMMKLEDNREICASCRSKPSSYRYKGYCQRQVRAAQTITTTVGVWSHKPVTLSGAECGGADFYDHERRVVTKTRDPGRAKVSRNLKKVAEVAQNL